MRSDQRASTAEQPPDVASFGFVVGTASAEGKVSEATAWAAVQEHSGSIYDGGKRTGYLVHVGTSPTTVRDVDVWMFELSGLSITPPMPAGVEAPPPPPFTTALVFVDATTGKWLGSMWK